MNTRFRHFTIATILSVIFFITPTFAEEGFKSVDVVKQGTTQASVSALPLKVMTGNITITKSTGPALAFCPNISFQTGQQSQACPVSGLTTGVTYYAIANGSGAFGTAYHKQQTFYMGNTPPASTTDVCSNIVGVQTTAPPGLVIDAFGACVTPPPPQTTVLTSTPTPVVSAVGATTTTTTVAQGDQCNDGKDNQIGDGKDYGYGVSKGDGKADHFGVDSLGPNGTPGDGVLDYEPDPSCFSPTATEEKGDDVVSTIIPCTDKCTFGDVFRLLNNLLTFFITTLLIPIFVTIVMYAGFKYITAEGNPGKIANLKKIVANIVLGIVLILCSWLIVRTIMTTLLSDNFKQSGVEFLGN